MKFYQVYQNNVKLGLTGIRDLICCIGDVFSGEMLGSKPTSL